MPLADIIYSIVVGGSIIIALTLFYQQKTAITVPAPTLPWVRKKVIQLFRKNIHATTDLKIADLGCGWGGMTIALAKEFPTAEIHGFEISIFPYIVSKIRSLRFLGRIKISRKDLFQQDLSLYQGLFSYLPPVMLDKLKPQLKSCLSETLIISNAFAIPEWTAFETDETNIGVKIPIYCYRVK